MPVGKRREFEAGANGSLISAVAEFLTLHNESVLIAPTRSAGEEAVHRMGRAAGVHRFTVLEFALEFARAGMAQRGLAPLTELGAEAVAARVVHEARAARKLRYFERVAGMAGFARALARTLAELRMARIGAGEIAERGAPGADLSGLLLRFETELEKMRLADQARVYEIARSGSSRLEGLPVALLDVPVRHEAQRVFLDFVMERAGEVLIVSRGGEVSEAGSTLERLRAGLFSESRAGSGGDAARSGPESTPDGAGFEIFSAPGEGLEAVEIARRILRLARGGTRFDEVAILLRSPERYQPMVEDALRRARIPAYFSRGTARPDAGGRAFLALLACAAEKCSASRFAEYLSLGQVPEDSRPVAGEPDGPSHPDDWIPADDEMLGGERFEIPEADVDEARVARAPASWEKLLTDAAVMGGRDRWRRRLSGLEREFELRLKTASKDDETRREEMARKLDQLRELERFALPLIDMLWTLPRRANWREWIQELSALARAALRRPEPVLAVLAEFEPMGEVGPASLEEVAGVLSERLRFLRRDPPDRRYGRVFVGSVDEARGREFGVVFLPGLAEGLFPQRAMEDPLLLDEFRKGLKGEVGVGEKEADVGEKEADVCEKRGQTALSTQTGLDRLGGVDRGQRSLSPFFAQTGVGGSGGVDRGQRSLSPFFGPMALREDKTREERERLRVACAAARERLVASYPRMDVSEARPRVPSFYALELPRAIEGRLPKLKEFEQRTRDLAPARLNWPAPKEAADAIDDAEYDLAMLARVESGDEGHAKAARYLVETNAALGRSLRARWSRWEKKAWCEADGLVTRDAAALEVLEAKRLKARAWSASSLQHFAECPYRFALHGVLGIRPREEAAAIEQMDPLTRGGLFHAVQFALLEELRAAALLPVSASNLSPAMAIADGVLDRVAARYEEDLAPAIERVWSSEIEDLRTDVRGWLRFIAANDDEWMPAHFEFAFGMEASEGRDAASTTEVAELDGVKLRGSIDLVERHVSRGALRVTDHKTGKVPETTPWMVGGGRYLQPLLYGMAAEKLLGSAVECGRLFYATQAGGYTPVEIKLDARARQFLAKLLANIDGSIAGGFLPAAPQKGTCEGCDYREVCGPYEETRCAKKDRRDERFEALTEIRGMA